MALAGFHLAVPQPTLLFAGLDNAVPQLSLSSACECCNFGPECLSTPSQLSFPSRGRCRMVGGMGDDAHP